MTVIDGTPIDEEQLRGGLARIGVEPGATLVVHSSLRAIGWVLGGAPTVVRALLSSVGPDGTLAMPAATPLCADPATWREPEVPPALADGMRARLPAFDARTTPTSMGAV